MTKSILSVSGTFLSLLCVIILLTAFAKSGEDLFAFGALISGFAVLVSIGYGIEGTKIADKLSNLFGEEVSHE